MKQAKAKHHFRNDVLGDIGKGQVITAPDDYIDLLIKNNLAEPIETKPEPKAELETKPQPKKKAKVKK